MSIEKIHIKTFRALIQLKHKGLGILAVPGQSWLHTCINTCICVQRSTEVVSKPNKIQMKLHYHDIPVLGSSTPPSRNRASLLLPNSFWLAQRFFTGAWRPQIVQSLQPSLPQQNGPIPSVMPFISAQIFQLDLTHLMVVRLNKMLIYLNNSQRKVQVHLQDLCLMQSGSKPGEEVIILSYAAF